MLGRVLSFDTDGTTDVLNHLESAYVDMKAAYEGLKQAEFQVAQARGYTGGSNLGLTELADYLQQYLAGSVPDNVLLSAIEELRAQFLDSYEKLGQRIADMEREGLEHLVGAGREALEGYSIGYSTMQTMEHAIYYSDMPLLHNCAQDLRIAIDYLSRARNVVDDFGSEDEWLDMQETYNVYTDPAYTESLADAARRPSRKAA
jgi:hypothetical protein